VTFTHPPCALDDGELDRILGEDVGHGDLTTAALGIGARPARIDLSARDAMVVCGVEEAARLFSRNGCQVSTLIERGSRVERGTLLLAAEGRADALHRVWKSAQTLIEHAAGIATATAQMVRAVAGIGKTPVVVCTRKNFPGTRAIAALAVQAGGAQMHRLGLGETLLLFPEHRQFIAPAALARAGVEILQLERFSPERLAELLRTLNHLALPCLVAAAGGVTLANAAAYARAGADILVSSAPYFAAPAEVQVRFTPAAQSASG